MDSKYNKMVFILLIVFGIIFTIIGSTFAYFAASASSNGDNISGSTVDFDVNMNVTSIKSGNLIPVVDDLVDDSLNSSHICTDTRGYGLCSLYKITFTNNGDMQSLTGHLKTNSTSYTTNNLKYQLYTLSGSTYSAASDIKQVPAVNNTSAFTLSNNNITVSLNKNSVKDNYYLVIWLSDIGNNQLADSNKTYNGSIVFSSANGNTISVDFS